MLLSPPVADALKYWDIIKRHDGGYVARNVAGEKTPLSDFGSFMVVTYIEHLATNELHLIDRR